MWEDNFDEKEYKSMKYVSCYCDKHAKVLVGQKLQSYINVGLGIPIAIFFFFLFLLSNMSFLTKLYILIPLTLVCILLPRSFYKAGRKMMLDADHSDYCSRKIGRLVMKHAGAHSPFGIMKNDKAVKKTDTK